MTTKQVLRASFLALATWGVTAFGCSRGHLTASHAESTRAFFGRQTVDPSAGERKKPAAVFDAQDAKVVVGTYRTAMGGKEGGGSAPSQGFMIVGPQGSTSTGSLPAPSVPTGR